MKIILLNLLFIIHMISLKSLIFYLNLYSEPPSICSYSEEVRDVKKHRKSAGSSIPWRGKFEQRGKAAESPWNSIEELSSQKILSSHILKFSQNELSGIDSKIIVENVYISDQFRFKSVRVFNSWSQISGSFEHLL